MVAFEHQLAAGPLGLTPDMQIVTGFLQVAEHDPACGLLVLNNKFLRKKWAFGLSPGEQFKVCRLSEVNREALVKACVSHGHLSVWFIPQNPGDLLRQFEQMGFFGPGINVPFGSSQPGDPLGVEEAQSLRSFLTSSAGATARALFAFSHDAMQFYRVYPV